MIWLTDYHGVLSTYPKFFTAAPADLYVLSASYVQKRQYIEAVIAENGLWVQDILMMPATYAACQEPKGFWLFQNKWKLNQIMELNPDFYFDDEEVMVRQVYTLREMGMVKTIPIHFMGPERLLDEAIPAMQAWAVDKDEVAKRLIEQL